MSAVPTFHRDKARVDEKAVKPFPNSKKVYVEGSRKDIRVPMREISCADTVSGAGREKNPPVCVYDTSGPYTDPEVTVDIRKGLDGIRGNWIEERQDSERLGRFTSSYSTKRLRDKELESLRFINTRLPRRARPGRNVSQLHYARQGIVTPEMEFIAIRENQRLEQYLDSPLAKYHAGAGFGASIPARVTPEFVRDEVARGRAIIPANINRPEFPGQGQCQYRQFGGDIVHRRGSREDDLGHPLGCGYGNGPVYRAQYP